MTTHLVERAVNWRWIKRSDDARKELLALFSCQTISFVRTGSHDDTYHLAVDGQTAILGDAKSLFSFRNAQPKIWASTGRVLPNDIRAYWPEVVRLLGLIEEKNGQG